MPAKTQPASISTILGDKHPTLAVEAVILVGLFTLAGWLRMSRLWQTAIDWRQVARLQTLVSLNLLFLFWPVTALVIMLVARQFGHNAPFHKLLHVTGKIWILYAGVLVLRDFGVVGLAAVGWDSGAGECFRVFSLLSRVVLWLLYPFAVATVYGIGSQSCLIVLLTYGIVLLSMFIISKLEDLLTIVLLLSLF